MDSPIHPWTLLLKNSMNSGVCDQTIARLLLRDIRTNVEYCSTIYVLLSSKDWSAKCRRQYAGYHWLLATRLELLDMIETDPQMRQQLRIKDERQLKDLAGVGPATLEDLALLGVRSVTELAEQDGTELYERLCHMAGVQHDVCCLDVFRCAVAQARDPELPDEQRNWWYWSRLRKKKAPAWSF